MHPPSGLPSSSRPGWALPSTDRVHRIQSVKHFPLHGGLVPAQEHVLARHKHRPGCRDGRAAPHSAPRPAEAPLTDLLAVHHDKHLDVARLQPDGRRPPLLRTDRTAHTPPARAGTCASQARASLPPARAPPARPRLWAAPSGPTAAQPQRRTLPLSSASPPPSPSPPPQPRTTTRLQGLGHTHWDSAPQARRPAYRPTRSPGRRAQPPGLAHHPAVPGGCTPFRQAEHDVLEGGRAFHRLNPIAAPLDPQQPPTSVERPFRGARTQPSLCGRPPGPETPATRLPRPPLPRKVCPATGAMQASPSIACRTCSCSAAGPCATALPRWHAAARG